jgi:type IV secretory pathway TraG/TraD family ATPase VirD4
MDYMSALRNKRLLKLKLQRGVIKKASLYKNPGITAKFVLVPFILFWCGSAILYGFWFSQHVSPYYQRGKLFFDIGFLQITMRKWFIFSHSFWYGLSCAILFAMIYFLTPVYVFFRQWFRLRKIPPRTIFVFFTMPYKILSITALAIILVYLLRFKPFAYYHWKHLVHYGFNFHYFFYRPDFRVFMIEVGILVVVLLICVFGFMPKHYGKYKASLFAKVMNLFGMFPFTLYLGESTGILIDRQHGAGIAPKLPINLSLQDAAQNIIAFGGVGEGKTTAVIYPLLIQLLEQNCGGLVFDIKGNFKIALQRFAELTDREIITIGTKRQSVNLLQGLTPETAAEYLRATLTLHGSGAGKEKHWLNAAATLACSVLGMLSFVPLFYTLESLHRFLHDERFREDIQNELRDLKLVGRNKRLLDHYVHQYDTVFTGNNERYQKDVLATMSEVLAGFTHPDIADAFCAPGENAYIPNMLDVLDGKVFFVDMPLNIWGMAGNLVYMFIKLRFFDTVKQRLVNLDLNQKRPVFFMCDEYQRLVDRSEAQLNSDLNFWDISRAAKCIGVITTQSISSFYSAVGDDRITDAILQNFRQKICLKTEDRSTIQHFEFIFGKVEVGKYSYVSNRGYNKMDGKRGKHCGSSESISYAKESVVDSQLYRVLKPNQAIASLIIGNRAMDDVVNLFPVRN